jgi:hypothetical protein
MSNIREINWINDECDIPNFILNSDYEWIEPFLEGGFGYIGNGMFVYEAEDNLLKLTYEDISGSIPVVIGKIVN